MIFRRRRRVQASISLHLNLSLFVSSFTLVVPVFTNFYKILHARLSFCSWTNRFNRFFFCDNKSILSIVSIESLYKVVANEGLDLTRLSILFYKCKKLLTYGWNEFCSVFQHSQHTFINIVLTYWTGTYRVTSVCRHFDA